MTVPFPTVSFDELSHVGTFDPSHKQKGSLEGAGLSVSIHPEDWEYIAKLGGNPTWILTKENNSFLDAHSLKLAQKKLVLAWAAERGWVEECDLWRWRRWDEDLKSYVISRFESRAEAVEEAGDCAEEEGELWGTVRKISGHRSTSLLDQVATQSRPTIGSDMVLDLLLPIYADEILGLDGVWWWDLHDPFNYSAPRGVIALSKLPSWSRCLEGVEMLAA